MVSENGPARGLGFIVYRHSNFPHICEIFAVRTGNSGLFQPALFCDIQVARHLAFRRTDQMIAYDGSAPAGFVSR